MPESWVSCSACGPRARLEFHTPEQVHCSDCGQIVGETTEPVERGWGVAFEQTTGIVDTETGETVASVNWRTDCVEVADGGA